MQTKQIVQASANVIRITNLQVGDIYKRFDDSSYSKTVKFGIVRGVYNDGTKTFVESVEYTKSYRSIEAEIYIIRGDNDVAIFPATLEEIQEEFGNAERSIKESIEDKREELAKLEQALLTTQQLITGELQQSLQTPAFKEMSQAKFNAKQLERANAELE
jgi:hypothetical protein